jgi:hypothetical protein
MASAQQVYYNLLHGSWSCQSQQDKLAQWSFINQQVVKQVRVWRTRHNRTFGQQVADLYVNLFLQWSLAIIGMIAGLEITRIASQVEIDTI